MLIYSALSNLVLYCGIVLFVQSCLTYNLIMIFVKIYIWFIIHFISFVVSIVLLFIFGQVFLF